MNLFPMKRLGSEARVCEPPRAKPRWSRIDMDKGKRYDSTWRKLRRIQLIKDPFCAFCRKMGRVTAATVADHIVPIRDDPKARLDPENLQSLCKECHDTIKQKIESGSYAPVGFDGMPMSKDHPWNKE